MSTVWLRVGVGFEMPLSLASAALLRSIAKDKKNRLYFESAADRSEEKFSAQLIDHELGTGSVARLLSMGSEEAWNEEVDRLRLGSPLRRVVTVHRDVVHFQEHDLGRRVHPCLVRLHDLSADEVIEALREGVKTFVALGVPEQSLKVSSALADWS